MSLVKRTVLVAHSCEKMFALVENVTDYPKFLPWCGGARVQPLTTESALASVDIDFKGLRQTFTTRNLYGRHHTISLSLEKGPFSSLNGTWRFIPLSEEACEVQFELHYVFASGLLGPLLTPVFDAIAGSFIDAFVARAEVLYG